MRFILIIFFSVALNANNAYAACTSPPGQASQTRYDSAQNKMYYCNNSTWVDMGGGAAGFSNPATTSLNMNGNTITNLAAPSAAADAAPRSYVDGKFGALTVNKLCRGTGTQIVCDQNPAAGDGDTLAGLACATGEMPVKTAGGWGCTAPPPSPPPSSGCTFCSGTYYLSATTHTGATAKNACAAGYHICQFDTTNGEWWQNRTYDSSKGDSSPWGKYGFIHRTTEPSYTNCNNWSDTSGGAWSVRLTAPGTSNGGSSGGICTPAKPVWCCNNS